jgi:hypothetical protein
MTHGDIFLILVISGFSLFGAVLGLASWEESQARRRKR